MKNVLTVSILISVLTLCGRNQTVDESLDRAESCMSASPDSALAILESIDSLHFDSRSQNARYALLKSIALDKNYIDRTDDSLVNIAVSYYRHRRNAVQVQVLLLPGPNLPERRPYGQGYGKPVLRGAYKI